MHSKLLEIARQSCRMILVISLFVASGPSSALAQDPAPATPEVTLSTSDRQRLDQLELDVMKLQGVTQQKSEEDGKLKLKSYSGGQRSLQALNPEISVVGDIFGRYLRSPEGRDAIGDERSGAFLRVLGLHLQSNLDPFAFARMAVELHPDGAEVGEAYVTWTSIFPGASLTVGKFRQQLGVVNRWHKPGLDQFDFPLMLTVPFGPGGLNQSGFSLNVALPPLWSNGMELFVQVTNGSNDRAFSGNFFSLPAGLVHLGNFWDLSSSTYLELGLSGMFGFNNHRNVVEEDNTVSSEDWRKTFIGGLDLTLNWEPLNRSKYHYFTWRSEFLFIQKEVSAKDTIRWMGAYSYLEYKLNRSWIL